MRVFSQIVILDMQLSLHTIWVSMLVMMTLLASSLVSSAPLMAITMSPTSAVSHSVTDDANPPQHCSNMNAAHHDSDASDMISSAMSNDCIDHSGQGVDSCCSVMCMTTLAFFITEHQPFTPHAVLLLINVEATRGIVTVARSLYRPPIA